jgi:hypothetical protein
LLILVSPIRQPQPVLVLQQQSLADVSHTLVFPIPDVQTPESISRVPSLQPLLPDVRLQPTCTTLVANCTALIHKRYAHFQSFVVQLSAALVDAPAFGLLNRRLFRLRFSLTLPIYDAQHVTPPLEQF